jgi:integrase
MSIGGSCDSRSMRLTSLLTTYLSEREASPRYAESLRRTVRKAGVYGLDLVSQLDAESVNKFLANLTLSSVTRSNIRRELLTLWRFAFEHAYTDVPPVRVLRIRAPRKPPVAWSRDTLSRLLDAAEGDSRPISARSKELRWCHAMPAWIAISYDTGLRFTDVLNLREESIRNGCVVVSASKTGKSTVRGLSAYAMSRIALLLRYSPDGTIFRWAITRRRAFKKWREFLDELGIDGTPRFLRRSSATYVEKIAPGSAPAFLDHSNPALAKLHYLDMTLMKTPVGPEPLR